MKKSSKIFHVILFCIVVSKGQNVDPLSFAFDKKYGQVEVGGPFVGMEFHHSNPLPSRISFYYPVANSIDVSTGYWERDASRPMAIGIQVGNGKKKWIGKEGWRYDLSPHTVSFYDRDSLVSYKIRYEFCLNEPAAVFSLNVKNESGISRRVTVYSHLLLALRTCQTYSRKDSAAMEYIPQNQAVIANFPDADTKFASVFVMNAGEHAAKTWIDADEIRATDDGKSLWIDSTLAAGELTAKKRIRAMAAYQYVKELQPGEVMTIVQVIGSSNQDEAAKKVLAPSTIWQNEINAFNDLVRKKASSETIFRTNDPKIDRTLQWSKAILTTNAHYIDWRIVPMPCPAEYNFFFTHDLLMTNLGAVNFDLDRVKNNLLYVASLAKDSIIPHAFYWKDDGFKLEMCTPSNWNHLWFIEVSASYLRHSLDTATIKQLYPLISKSLSEILTQLKSDNLMYAFRPDWWDLGWKEGPRTYITALSIRAIEDYLFIASMIDKGNPSLLNLEHHANNMRSALVTKLWDDSVNFLINYNGADKDIHRYMGSLLAPSYHLLDEARTNKMLETTKEDLLAPNVGIRAVMPADFDQDSVIKYFKIVGDEAGKAYTYINGGVWPHNNAWYALALNAAEKSEEALAFVKQMMTIDGVAESPNGIPAMYEYRYSNPSSSKYGEIDKPSFLWAGGFYLYTMYTLAGMNDNVWNLSVGENHAQFDSTIYFNYTFGDMKDVSLGGNGKQFSEISFDGKKIPSLILPVERRSAKNISIKFGSTSEPYLTNANAVVHSVKYSTAKKQFECMVSSFKGHSTTLNISGKAKPNRILLNGKLIKNVVVNKKSETLFNIAVMFTASNSSDKITIKW